MKTEVTIMLEDGTFRRRVMDSEPNDEDLVRWVGGAYRTLHPGQHTVLFGTVYVKANGEFGERRNTRAEESLGSPVHLFGRVIVTRPAPAQTPRARG